MTIISSGDSFSGLSFSCTVLVIMMCFYLFQNVCFLHFILHTSKTHTLAILFSGGELAFLLLCTLLKIHALAILVQKVVGLVLNVHSAGDTECGLSCFSG